MFDVETLFVIPTRRGFAAVEELLQSLEWACKRSYFVVVVDIDGDSAIVSNSRVQVVNSDLPATVSDGFHAAAGLKWAISESIGYANAILISDKAVVLNTGFDALFLDNLKLSELGLTGVKSLRDKTQTWRKEFSTLVQLGLRPQTVEAAIPTLCDDFLILSHWAASVLYQRAMLVPAIAVDWTDNYATYLTWVVTLLGFKVVYWGTEDRPLVPLYVNEGAGQHMPPPHALRPEFSVFAPVTGVRAFSESDIREMNKARRGDAVGGYAVTKPIVTQIPHDDMEPLNDDNDRVGSTGNQGEL